MASFVKGASSNPDLERVVGLFWMLAWHLDIRVWFEWVDSGSNWSDGVSRLLQADPFAAENGFTLEPMGGPGPQWSASWQELWAFAKRASKKQALEKTD